MFGSDTAPKWCPRTVRGTPPLQDTKTHYMRCNSGTLV